MNTPSSSILVQCKSKYLFFLLQKSYSKVNFWDWDFENIWTSYLTWLVQNWHILTPKYIGTDDRNLTSEKLFHGEPIILWFFLFFTLYLILHRRVIKLELACFRTLRYDELFGQKCLSNFGSNHPTLLWECLSIKTFFN